MFFDDDDDGFGLDDAMMLGTGYALYRHGQDRQAEAIGQAVGRAVYTSTERLIDELSQKLLGTESMLEPEPEVINNLDYTTASTVGGWEDYIGQEALKRQIMLRIQSALMRHAPMPHTLLKSGYPGVGKTTMARLIARAMGVRIIEIVPPFKLEALVKAATQLGNKDILFIDEIHKLTDGVGARGAEILLKVLEDRVIYLPDGTVIPLNLITVIGATTEDTLPETIIDRFKLKPYFSAYTAEDLVRIAVQKAWGKRAEMFMTDDLYIAIGQACRGTPRIIEEMVDTCLDLGIVTGQAPTPQLMLDTLEYEPDGLTRLHVHYLTAMRQYFGREIKDTGEYEYVIGEAAIMQILRETKQGIGRIERFLVERGLIDRTPRGRRLTASGIARAEAFIAAGKGAADVA